MDRKIFTDAEHAEVGDFNDIGVFARDGVDHVVGGAIAYPRHWSGFIVSQTNPIQVGVSPGSLFVGDKVYRHAAPAVIDVQTYLPLIGSDRKIIAILADGDVATIEGARLVEVDVDTEETVSQVLPVAETRKVSFAVLQGAPSPTPAKPAVPADRCCIAFVELSNTAIFAIELNHELRVKTAYEIEGRVTDVEGTLVEVSSQVGNMRTQIADIFSRLGDIPSPIKMRQLTRDVATLRLQAKLPADTRAYWYDPGLVADQWDINNPSFLARIREGVRFAYAAQRDTQLSLIQNDNPAIKVTGNLVLPAWTERLALEVLGDGGSVNISELAHSVVTAKKKTLSRTVTEYGPTVTVCENAAEWAFLHDKSVGELFTKNGETFEIASVTPLMTIFGPWAGHNRYAIRKVIKRTVTDTYWDYITTQIGLNGSIYGQTFLNAQASIVTSIELKAKTVGVNGDVHLLIMQCREDGSPDFNAVIEHVVKPIGQLAIGWVKFDLTPTLLDAGKRYAWATVTTGNHAIETVSGNKFAQGSRFICTDGVWAAPSVDSDFAFRLNVASFAATRTAVEFNSLTLDNGMTEVRLLHAGWEAAGVPVTWQIRNPALGPAATWQSLSLDNPDGADDLVGLPPLVQLRALFMGTTDLQPALVLDSNARGMTFRPRGDCVALGQAAPFGLTTTTIQTETELDNFDPVKHSASPKLMIGGAPVTPAILSTEINPANVKKRRLLATFTVPATSSAAYRCDLTTTEVTDLPFIQDALMSAL